MINMDMVGRLDRTTKSLMVNGTGTSPVWEPLLQRLTLNKVLADLGMGIAFTDGADFSLTRCRRARSRCSSAAITFTERPGRQL